MMRPEVAGGRGGIKVIRYPMIKFPMIRTPVLKFPMIRTYVLVYKTLKKDLFLLAKCNISWFKYAII